MSDGLKHVLSVSYDLTLLSTRHLLLESDGYEVTSTDSCAAAVEQFKQSRFDLFIVGHSMPAGDKKYLIQMFRANCLAPILSLQRKGEENVPDADFYISPDTPDKLLHIVARILREHNSKPHPMPKKPPSKITHDDIASLSLSRSSSNSSFPQFSPKPKNL